jgi:hypothetical protein
MHGLLSIGDTCATGFKHAKQFIQTTLLKALFLYCTESPQLISGPDTPSADKNLINASCSSLVQMESSVAMLTVQ